MRLAILLSLQGALLLVLSSIVGSVSFFYSHASSALQAALAEQVLDSRLIPLRRALLSNRWLPPPTIHPPGIVQLADGSSLEFSHQRYRPALNSQGISAAIPLQGCVLWVIDRSKGSTNSLTACAMHSSECGSFHGEILGISPTGLVELQGELAPISPTCFSARITSTGGMLVAPTSSTALQSVSLLYPLQDVFTLYLDRQQTVRYVQHLGSTIIENQPIHSGIALLRFSLLQSLTIPESTFALIGEGQTVTDRRFSLSLWSPLPRRDISDLLMNGLEG